MNLPTAADITKARTRIQGLVHKTPVLSSLQLNEITGARLYFKCENFQKVGAFKFRGASNAVSRLSANELKRGVATHSSGNHAAALALAARMKGAPAHIVMPENAPEIKKKAVAGYGAQITFCIPTQVEREKTLAEVVERTGASFVHPYDNFHVVAGQGTAVMELMEEVQDPEVVMCPVGGGGLLSGTATWVKENRPQTEVIAGEPLGADDAWRSYTTGVLTPMIDPKTIADGLLTSLCEMTFAIIQDKVDDILRVKEESIVQAMRLVWERMKIIIEPSSAVPLAAILENPDRFRNKKVGIILSGGNVDLKKLPF